MPLSQHDFSRQVGDNAVIWISPRRVHQKRGTKWPVGKNRLAQLGRWLPDPLVRALRPGIKRREPFVTPAEQWTATRAVVDSARYQLIDDFIRHRNHPTHPRWYRQLHAALDSDGTARHKTIVMRSQAEILAFLSGYIGGLANSLERDGFSPEHDGFSATVAIDADGALCKTGSGNHRVALAHVLGLSRFPVRIAGVHEDWACRCGLERACANDFIPYFKEVEAAYLGER